jgi:hypothetical protein
LLLPDSKHDHSERRPISGRASQPVRLHVSDEVSLKFLHRLSVLSRAFAERRSRKGLLFLPSWLGGASHMDKALARAERLIESSQAFIAADSKVTDSERRRFAREKEAMFDTGAERDFYEIEVEWVSHHEISAPVSKAGAGDVTSDSSRELVAAVAVPLVSAVFAGLTLLTPAPRLALAVLAISLGLGSIALGLLRERWRKPIP